jgi:hypothetical protein
LLAADARSYSAGSLAAALLIATSLDRGQDKFFLISAALQQAPLLEPVPEELW